MVFFFFFCLHTYLPTYLLTYLPTHLYGSFHPLYRIYIYISTSKCTVAVHSPSSSLKENGLFIYFWARLGVRWQAPAPLFSALLCCVMLCCGSLLAFDFDFCFVLLVCIVFIVNMLGWGWLGGWVGWVVLLLYISSQLFFVLVFLFFWGWEFRCVMVYLLIVCIYLAPIDCRVCTESVITASVVESVMYARRIEKIGQNCIVWSPSFYMLLILLLLLFLLLLLLLFLPFHLPFWTLRQQGFVLV